MGAGVGCGEAPCACCSPYQKPLLRFFLVPPQYQALGWTLGTKENQTQTPTWSKSQTGGRGMLDLGVLTQTGRASQRRTGCPPAHRVGFIPADVVGTWQAQIPAPLPLPAGRPESGMFLCLSLPHLPPGKMRIASVPPPGDESIQPADASPHQAQSCSRGHDLDCSDPQRGH